MVFYEDPRDPKVEAEKQAAAAAKAAAQEEKRAAAEEKRRAAAEARAQVEEERRAAAEARKLAAAEARAKAEEERRAASEAKMLAEKKRRDVETKTKKMEDGLRTRPPEIQRRRRSRDSRSKGWASGSCPSGRFERARKSGTTPRSVPPSTASPKASLRCKSRFLEYQAATAWNSRTVSPRRWWRFRLRPQQGHRLEDRTGSSRTSKKSPSLAEWSRKNSPR